MQVRQIWVCVGVVLALTLFVTPSLSSDDKAENLAKGFYVLTREDGKFRLGYTSGDGKFQVGSKRTDSPPVLEEVILPPIGDATPQPVLVDPDNSRSGNWLRHDDHSVSYICSTALAGSETEKFKGDSNESKVRSCYDMTKNGVKSDTDSSESAGSDVKPASRDVYFCMVKSQGKYKLAQYNSADNTYKFGGKDSTSSTPQIKAAQATAGEKETEERVNEKKKGEEWKWVGVGSSGKVFDCGGDYKRDSEDAKLLSCMEAHAEEKLTTVDDSSSSEKDHLQAAASDSDMDGGKHFVLINTRNGQYYKLALFNPEENTYTLAKRGGDKSISAVLRTHSSDHFKGLTVKATEEEVGDEWLWKMEGKDEWYKCAGDENGRYLRDSDEDKVKSCAEAHKFDKPASDGEKYFVLINTRNGQYYKLALFNPEENTYTLAKRGGDKSISAVLRTHSSDHFKGLTVKATEEEVGDEWLWKMEGKDEWYKCAGDENGRYLRDSDENKVKSCAEADRFEMPQDSQKPGEAAWFAVQKDGKYSLALKREGKWTVASGETAVQQEDAPENDKLVLLNQTTKGIFTSQDTPGKEFKCATGPIDSSAGEEDVIAACGELKEQSKEADSGITLDKPDVHPGSIDPEPEMSKKPHFVMMETLEGYKLGLYNPESNRYTFSDGGELKKVDGSEEVRTKTKNAKEKKMKGEWVWEAADDTWYKCSGEYNRESDESKLKTCALATSFTPDGKGDKSENDGSNDEGGDGSRGLDQCRDEKLEGDHAYETCESVVSSVCSFLCTEPGCPKGKLFKYNGKCVAVACQGDEHQREMYFAKHDSACPSTASDHPPESSVPEEKRELFNAMFQSLLCNAAFGGSREAAKVGHAKHCMDYVAEMKHKKLLLE